VAVVDAGRLGEQTTAHGEGNLLASDKTPGPELDLALASLDLWHVLAADLSEELGPRFPSLEYQRKGALVAVTRDDAVPSLRALVTSQRESGVEVHDLDPAEAAELEPDLTPSLTGGAYYPRDAQLHPVVAAQALAASARRAGVMVGEGWEVRAGIVGKNGRVSGVATSRGDIPAGNVVVAAGPWSGEVARRLGARLAVQPRRGAVLVTTPMPPRVRHKVYDGDYVGATQSPAVGLQVSAVVESTRAGTVLVGSSREQVGFDSRVPAGVYAQIARRAAGLFPFLAEVAVMRAYSGWRPYVPDHLPVIGPAPGREGLWFATGHEGAGIGLAPATAAMMAALLLGGSAPVDPAPFHPGRPGLAEVGGVGGVGGLAGQAGGGGR
jgi:glycine/D-amino acid oxidase-like deaminating enzyme